MLDDGFLEILRCPVTKDRLVYVPSENLLLSPTAKLVYRIEDRVPVLLAEEGKSVDGKEIERLTALAASR